MLWLLYAIILVVLFVAVRVIPQLSNKLVDSSLVEFGELKISEEAQATIVRDDMVFFCQDDCKLEKIAEENSQVKVGTRLFKYHVDKAKDDERPEKSAYDELKKSLSGYYKTVDNGRAQKKGIFSLSVDGLEKVLRPDKIASMTKEKTLSRKSKKVDLTRKRAFADEPIYKISNNSRWYMVFWTDLENSKHYEKGSNVDVVMKDDRLKCRIESVTKQDSDYRVVISTNRYYKDFANLRRANIEVVSLQLSGLLVNNEDIIRRNRQEGVMVFNKSGDQVFTPIKVIASDGKQSVVAEDTFFDEEGRPVKTVQVFDEVLANPDG